MSEYYDNYGMTESVVVDSPVYKVRSLFHSPKLFENYNDAAEYYEQCLDENDFDLVQIYESTASGWKEL